MYTYRAHTRARDVATIYFSVITRVTKEMSGGSGLVTLRPEVQVIGWACVTWEEVKMLLLAGTIPGGPNWFCAEALKPHSAKIECLLDWPCCFKARGLSFPRAAPLARS